MKKSNYSGFETTVVGDITLVSDLNESQGITFSIHDFKTDVEYAFTREQARTLKNFLDTHFLNLEVTDA